MGYSYIKASIRLRVWHFLVWGGSGVSVFFSFLFTFISTISVQEMEINDLNEAVAWSRHPDWFHCILYCLMGRIDKENDYRSS